jgi:hypothetical protein
VPTNNNTDVLLAFSHLSWCACRTVTRVT